MNVQAAEGLEQTGLASVAAGVHKALQLGECQPETEQNRISKQSIAKQVRVDLNLRSPTFSLINFIYLRSPVSMV